MSLFQNTCYVFRIAYAAEEVFTSISVCLSTKTKSGQPAAATIAMRQILIARVGKQRLRYAGDYLPIYGAFWGSAFLWETQALLACDGIRSESRCRKEFQPPLGRLTPAVGFVCEPALSMYNIAVSRSLRVNIRLFKSNSTSSVPEQIFLIFILT